MDRRQKISVYAYLCEMLLILHLVHDTSLLHEQTDKAL